MVNTLPARAVLGFACAALSVLTFHQGMLGLLHVLAIPGLEIAATPWRIIPVPPFGVPLILNLCFWGGLYGVLFGILAPSMTWPNWLNGLLVGLLAMLVSYFVVAPIKGNPIGGGWVINNWIRGILINGSFGVGIGLIYPFAAERLLRRPATR